jgi:hypothetical protein
VLVLFSQLANVKIGVQSRTGRFLLLAVFIVLTVAMGYLYHQNKNYQYRNRRLIIVNDSVLSENLELRNALLNSKQPTVFKIVRQPSK